MPITKIILLDIPWNSQFARRVRRGIYRYARPKLPWVFASTDTRKLIRHAETAGIITMHRPEAYEADGQVVVSVGGQASGSGASASPRVDVDPKALGEMAAEYFIERGFDSFGVIALDTSLHSMPRGEAFVAALRRRKLTCDVFDPRKKYTQPGESLPSIVDSDERIRRWAASLPKPLAIFAIDDHVGLWTCVVCWSAGFRIPEDVAILSADDDEMFCDMAPLHLSSIQVPAEQVGFEAAKLLNAMLGGRKAPKRPILLRPVGVITRQSTDVLAVDDTYVVRAVRYIHEHALEGVRVDEVAAAMPMSRRLLERRFKAVLGRGPFAEIRRVQIEQIKILLAKTDKTIETIAWECGFDNVIPMSEAFKKAVGMPPGAYRRQFRSR